MLRLYRYCAFIGNQFDTRLAHKHAQRPPHADKHILHHADIGVVSRIYLEVFHRCQLQVLAAGDRHAFRRVHQNHRGGQVIYPAGYQCYLRGHIRRVGVRRRRVIGQFLDFIAQTVQFADNVGHLSDLTLRLVLRIGADKYPFLCTHRAPQIGTQFKAFAALFFPGINKMAEV
ncbi:Uncharacterised protein [Escherichia coli]|nr:Uncharacterised protein [Escherichia coli]